MLPYIFGDVPGDTTRVDVTLYTQLSANRLVNLLRISRLWPGPISAAVSGNADDIYTLRTWLTDAPADFKKRTNIWIHGVQHHGVNISH